MTGLAQICTKCKDLRAYKIFPGYIECTGCKTIIKHGTNR